MKFREKLSYTLRNTLSFFKWKDSILYDPQQKIISSFKFDSTALGLKDGFYLLKS